MNPFPKIHKWLTIARGWAGATLLKVVAAPKLPMAL